MATRLVSKSTKTGIKNLARNIEATIDKCNSAEQYINFLRIGQKINIKYGIDSKRERKNLITGQYVVTAIFKDKFHISGTTGTLIITKNDIVDKKFQEV